MKNRDLKDRPGRIGDRFKWEYAGRWYVWEIVATNRFNNYNVRVVDRGNLGYRAGDILNSLEITKFCTYLGNFAKSKNFNSLYEKLQGN